MVCTHTPRSQKGQTDGIVLKDLKLYKITWRWYIVGLTISVHLLQLEDIKFLIFFRGSMLPDPHKLLQCQTVLI